MRDLVPGYQYNYNRGYDRNTIVTFVGRTKLSRSRYLYVFSLGGNKLTSVTERDIGKIESIEIKHRDYPLR